MADSGTDPDDEAPACALLITCYVEVLGACDLAAIAALARLKLAADRLGCRLQVSGCSEHLVELISFVGLDDVLLVPRSEWDSRTARVDRVVEIGSTGDPTDDGSGQRRSPRRSDGCTGQDHYGGP